MRRIIIIAIFVVFAFPELKFGAETVTDKVKSEKIQNFREYIKYSHHVFLPDGMSKALKEYNPTFKIFRMEDFSKELRFRLPRNLSNLSCYSSVFGNFNDDGIFDATVFGEVDLSTSEVKFFPIFVILSEGTTSYKVVEVTKVAAIKPLSVYISIARRRIKCTPGVPAQKALLYPPMLDAVVVHNGSNVEEYYWDKTLQIFKNNQALSP
jgi:hypothetical protein